jgi:hypothetical protein
MKAWDTAACTQAARLTQTKHRAKEADLAPLPLAIKMEAAETVA